jgi:outer membrane protein insertion porin family
MKTLPVLASTLALALAAHGAVAQGGPATISTGASYSSSRGALAFVTFEAADMFGSGVDIGITFEKGEDGQAASASLAKSFDLGATRLGNDSAIRVALDGSSTDWSSQGYSASDYGLEVSFGASPIDNLTYDVRVFGRQTSFDDVGPDASPLLVADEGSSNAIGLGVNVAWSTLDDAQLPHSGFKLGADLAWASPAGDREWQAVSVTAGFAIPLSADFTLSVRGDAGRIEGLGGQNVSVVDRAFIGSPAPRGFASAGIGPRDFVDGSVNTPLGGNSYVTSSLELRYQTANPALSVGAFMDAGALWDLDVTAGGASGTIDDARYLRTAAGVSVYWQTKVGLMQISIAQPIESQDYDEEETFSLGVTSRF